MRVLFNFFYSPKISPAEELISQLDKFERKQIALDVQATCERGRELLKELKPGKIATSLRHRLIALKYRSGLLEPGRTDPEALIDFAASWKKGINRYPNPELSQRDLAKLEKCARYPEFLFLLLEDKILREEFFKWIIQDNNKVKPFIEFPAIQQRIKSCYLSSRIGRYAGKFLKIDHAKKDISLLINGRRVSLLDESQVVDLEFGWLPTVHEILQQFKSKNVETGNVYVHQKRGVINWCTHLLGRFDGKKVVQISLDDPEWWKQIPDIELTQKQIEEWMHITLQPDDWVLVGMANRQYPTRDVDKSHGFLGVLIPGDSGKWQFQTFGKYTKIYPLSLWQMLLFIGNTVFATIQSPDESLVYTNRQIAGIPIRVNREKGLEAMQEVARWIRLSRDDQVIFQLIYENCAYLPEVILNKVLGKRCPHLYRRYILDTEPTLEPLASIFHFIMFFPSRFHKMLMLIFEHLILSFRGHWVVEDGKRIFKSLATSDFRKRNEIFLPAEIFENASFVTYGN